MGHLSELRAVHIISSMARGGRERQLAIICKYSQHIDNRILIFHRAETGYIEEYGLQNLVTIIDVSGFWARLRQVKKIVTELQADILVSWGTLESIIAIITTVNGKPRFVNFSIRHGIRKFKLSQLFRTLVLRLSKHVMANSQAGLRANNLGGGMVLYNGIENLPPPLNEVDKQVLRTKLMGVKTGPMLISVANLVPYKDYPTVLKALSSLKSKGRNFFYIIVGDGPRRSELESLVSSHGMEANVMFTGRITNVGDYLDISDIMIHSSLGEGCSNAILEGMFHGLPIIATKVGGTPEIVSEKNALLFEYGDAVTLEKHMNILISDPSLMQTMGSESRDLAKGRFGLDTMINRYERVIRAVARKDRIELAELYERV